MGNGVLSMSTVKDKCVVLETYQLFNNINNGQPNILLDFRKNFDDYHKVRLKGSVHVGLEDLDSLSNLLEPVLYPHGKTQHNQQLRGVRYFTFLLPADFTEDEKTVLRQKFACFIESLGGTFVNKVPSSVPKIPHQREEANSTAATTTVTVATATETPNAAVVTTSSSDENNRNTEIVISTSTTISTTAETEVPSLSSVAKEKVAASPAALTEDHDSSTQLHIIVSIQYNCEQFFTRYESCSHLFDYEENSTKYVNYRTKYYASEIIPDFLYLGDYQNATEADQLQSLGITHIVDATFEHLSEEVACKLKLCYLPVDVWDTEHAEIKSYFSASNNFILAAVEGKNLAENNSKDTLAIGRDFSKLGDMAMIESREDLGKKCRVLVHCRAGWSRSPTLVVAFLMHHLKLTLLNAMRMVVKQRPMVCPNPSFRAQLMSFEKELFGSADHAEVEVPILCPDDQTLRSAISEESCLWTESITVETDYDRIPINAFKNKSAMMNDAFPNNAESQQQQPAKPKKPFLKRGEGKNIIPKKPFLKAKSGGKQRIYTPMSAPEEEPQQQPTGEEVIIPNTQSIETTADVETLPIPPSSDHDLQQQNIENSVVSNGISNSDQVSIESR